MSYTQFGYSTYAASSPLVIGGSSGQNSCYERTGVSPESQYDARLYPRLTSYAAPPYQPESNLDPTTAPFYTPTLNSTYGMKEGSDPWRSISQSASYYYDPTLAAYGYGGLDFNGARRKNVTRDSTSTLKAWLNEHRKNPYPTKGEKIMLAIITKMTLTQVSTWFANARRRLKKENKMTWEPRNKAEAPEEDAKREEEQKEEDFRDEEEQKPLRMHNSSMGEASDLHPRPENSFRSPMGDQQQLHYEDAPAELLQVPDASSSGYTPSVSSQSSSPDLGPIEAYMAPHHRPPKDSTTVSPSSCFPGDPSAHHLYKPKIWSLADTATNKVLDSMPYGTELCSQGWSPAKTPFQSCAIPFQRFGSYSCSLHSFNPISLQTDTPPQTPPNMKMSTVHQVVVPSTAYIETHGNTSSSYIGQPPPPLCSQEMNNGQLQDEKMETFPTSHASVLSQNTSSNQNPPSECISEDYDDPSQYSAPSIR